MPSEPGLKPEICNCLALRQAARLVTQVYDQFLAPSGIRTTQYSILAKLYRLGPMTINALATELVVDRTTLGRNVLPLERDGFIRIVKGTADARSKLLHVTKKGVDRLGRAHKGWAEAQKRFDSAFGGKRAADLRGLLRDIARGELAAAPLADSASAL